MYDPSFKRKVFALIAVMLVIIIGVLAYQYIDNYDLKVTYINPQPSTISAVTPFFDLYFNKTLSPNVEASMYPSAIKSYKVNGNEIAINFKLPLNFNLSYTLQITNISATDGKRLADLSYTFTPQQITSVNIPQDQNAPVLNEQKQYNQSVENNKLLQLLPFTGPNFEYTVSYSQSSSTTSSQNSLTIIITGATPEAQQAGYQWLSAQVTDIQAYNIQYVTAQPS